MTNQKDDCVEIKKGDPRLKALSPYRDIFKELCDKFGVAPSEIKIYELKEKDVK